MYVYFSTIYVHVVNNDFSDYIHAYIILKKNDMCNNKHQNQ